VTTRSVGYYRPGTSWIHRRNPVTKLLALVLATIAAFLVPVTALMILLLTFVVMAASAEMLGAVARTLRLPALLFASIVLVNAFFYPGAVERVFGIGPVGLSWEGTLFGVLSAARLLVVFVAAIVFLFTTLPDDLLEALVDKGASHRLAFVVLSAIQLIPRLQVRAASILDAQQARGLRVGGSFLNRARAVIPLLGPIVLASLIDVRERTLALEARAFGAHSRRTAYRQVSDPPGERWLRYGLLAAFVVLIVAVATGLLR
jgi:energy-coupling factor transport system permease protein